MRTLFFCAAGGLFLLIAPVRGQNLLTNGDFENVVPSTGWTPWRATWGANEARDFANTETGRNGARCLKLGAANTVSSFGVYQEVAVQPGKSYRLDAWWKGVRNGNDNWAEIILIDGAFSVDQADNPANKTNFMYAYDSPDNPFSQNFGWIWAHDQNGTPVDWNDRAGVRAASGNTMTVVLKAGACCGTTGASVWFDDVTLTEVDSSTPEQLQNGDFADGLDHWATWTARDSGGDFSAAVVGGELAAAGSNFAGGVYQQFFTGGAGNVVNIIGDWRSAPTLANAMFAEVWVINADRVPADGVEETDGVSSAILLYRNDTFAGRGAWDDAIARSAPVKHQISFVATGNRATLILKSGNNGPGAITGTVFDNVSVHVVPPPATLGNLPDGFALRSYAFPVAEMTSIAQNPVSRLIYAVRNDQSGGNTLLYRINVDGASLSTTQVANLSSTAVINPGFTDAQGMTFDTEGNVYISSQFGRIIKGVDTNPDPAVDTFGFSQMFSLPEPQIGTFHGIGGVAVGPDEMLYINSGSETHYGPEPQRPYNARILRAPLDASSTDDVQVFCEGIRNSFDISFRLDGLLFGVGNGPNLNCDYAEEFNLLESGQHYGFPYQFASDLSGADQSITCVGDPPRVGPQPLPPGLVTRPAWANYGPDAKPAPGQRGYVNGGEYFGFEAHSSPDGLDFYEPTLMDPAAIKFPPEFYGRAFVARLGQLEDFSAANNPNPSKVGFDVLSLRLDDAHEGIITNTFLTGLARAIDVLCAYNGKLYVLEFNQQTNWPGSGWGTPSRLYEISYTIPLAPLITVSTEAIDRAVFPGESVPSNDTFTVANGGTGLLSYEINVTFDTPNDPQWLEVSPLGGDSTGLADEDTITVAYLNGEVTALPIGDHVASIEITDPLASNSPTTITVTLTVDTVVPDFDQDGDVDQDDYALMQICFSGQGITPSATCAFADLDSDHDVDSGDFNAFHGCLSGPNLPAEQTCDDAFD